MGTLKKIFQKNPNLKDASCCKHVSWYICLNDSIKARKYTLANGFVPVTDPNKE
jgi:hypothetical protein